MSVVDQPLNPGRADHVAAPRSGRPARFAVSLLAVLGLTLGGVAVSGSNAAARTAVGPIAVVQAAARQAAAAPTRMATFDAQVLTLVNQARTSRGLAPVRAAKGLTSLSVWWSTQLAAGKTGYQLEHNPDAWSMLPRYGAASRTSWGENVAKFSPSSVPAVDIFNAYMNSPGHRANILGAGYRYIGIGTMAGSQGAFNTMTFTDKVDAGQVIVQAAHKSVSKSPVRGKLVAREKATGRPVAGVRYSVRKGSCNASAQVVQKITARSGAFAMDLRPGAYCAIPTAWPHAYRRPPRRDWVVRAGTGFSATAYLSRV